MKSLLRRISEIKTLLFETSGGKNISLWFSLFGLGDLLFWLIWLKMRGSVPSTDRLNLIFWHIDLPFRFSRLLDSLLAPICLLAIGFFAQKKYSRNRLSNYADDPFFSIIYLIIPIAALFAGGLIFGLPYAPFVLVAASFLFAALVLAFVLINDWVRSS